MSAKFPAGTRIDDYVVDGEIGSGGMGVVYRVHDASGQALAMKVVCRGDHGSAEEFERRVAREAHASEVIRHPGVVKVFRQGIIDDERRFLIMERLVGTDLETILDGPGLPLLDYVAILREALDVLAAAHSVVTLDGVPQPIIHRDIKPGNLFLLDPPVNGLRVKLLDFGLVRQAGAAPLSRSRTSFGTLLYMAPEQCRSAMLATPATDVWAIGVMLYEAATGLRPFYCQELYPTIARISLGHPAPIDQLDPAAPASLARLVDECLLPDPEMRPATARELARRLDLVLADPAFEAFARGRIARDPGSASAVEKAETTGSPHWTVAPTAPRQERESPAFEVPPVEVPPTDGAPTLVQPEDATRAEAEPLSDGDPASTPEPPPESSTQPAGSRLALWIGWMAAATVAGYVGVQWLVRHFMHP